jgi:lauroyl/myristoyl acyltransferase
MWAADSGRRLRGRDLLYLVHLPVIAIIAWFVPERWWPAVCRALVPLAGGLGIGRHMKAIERIAKLVDARGGGPDARRFVPMLSANSHRARLHVLRCYRPPEWRPQVELVGVEHIENALRAGRGAILWVAPLVFNDLLTKMTLHRAGFRVAHLSRDGHGFSPTRWGARFLNPIWTRIENRYLAERLVIRADRPSNALRTLVQRVRQNEVVSVTVGGQGARTIAAPFVNGLLDVADGVPALAMRTGAALLPVFTVETGVGRFVCTIAPGLRTPAAGDAGVRDLVEQEVALLESWVLRYPEQFVIWEIVRTRTDSAGAAGASR